MVHSMSMINAEKSQEYMYNLFIWSKYWASFSNFKGWGLTQLVYKKSVLMILVK